MADSLDPTKGQFLAYGIEHISEEEFLKSKSDPNAPDGRAACAICLEEYSYEGGTDTERPVRILACSHWVGSTCIQLILGNQCPFCRARLFKKEEEKEPSPDIDITVDWASDTDDTESSLSDIDDDINWIRRIRLANASLARYLNHLHTANGRTTNEQQAAWHAWDVDWHRTVSAHQARATTRRIAVLPTTTAHDSRDYALIPAFELACPRDVAPLAPVDPRRWRGIWLSVRPEAIEFNLDSAFNSFRALGMLKPPAQESDPLSGATTEWDDWENLFQLAIDEVVVWCLEHDREFWRAEELEQRWKTRAVDSIWRGGDGGWNPPPQGLERAVDALIEFVVGWRVLREMEVWEELVSDGAGDGDLLGV
ncbi:hypothetical protein DIS24_g430 [Lasiodiplodia hormozganensis]|uniref:RING-type domain-containing protein n=1 Tax=Lasiodiplodia hormozganensis TaxID=869390 RepID=A0AA40D906_9PEZI|nr:hypothetical protein DIS24_g430 [Lasiodiplodia hormozganensis]